MDTSDLPVLSKLLAACRNPVHIDLNRAELIRRTIERGEALVSAGGALATWTRPESTGRSPKDTVIVRRPQSEGNIDWDSPNCLPIEPSTFDLLVEDALAVLPRQPELFVSNRVVGADPAWALPVTLVSDRALSALFAINMFRPVPDGIGASVFARRPFLLLALPGHKLDPARYQGRLRIDPATGRTSTMAVAMDLDRRTAVVYGSAYCGSIKKTIFSVMNYYLPDEGILPLHCSANEGRDGATALMLGLSGTGKTTLSADPERSLLGDDEHGWSDAGIANFEYGCYAKLIDLDPEREPEIHRAVFHHAPPEQHGAIVENAMFYPDGRFDLSDDRLTANSRASFPLSFLSNVKEPPVGGHPRAILFLTADANGVLPPVARLSRQQAMLWFLMGYTSKLAGTETGVVEPRTVFSRFFGEPFMPRNPADYAGMLGSRMADHDTDVYLINTGWTGGPYGTGRRIDIRQTRAIVRAAVSGGLQQAEGEPDRLFHLRAPRACPGIDDPRMLNPRSTWADPNAFDQRARGLAAQFATHFDKAYGGKGISEAVAATCPGH